MLRYLAMIAIILTTGACHNSPGPKEPRPHPIPVKIVHAPPAGGASFSLTALIEGVQVASKAAKAAKVIVGVITELRGLSRSSRGPNAQDRQAEMLERLQTVSSQIGDLREDLLNEIKELPAEIQVNEAHTALETALGRYLNYNANPNDADLKKLESLAEEAKNKFAPQLPTTWKGYVSAATLHIFALAERSRRDQSAALMEERLEQVAGTVVTNLKEEVLLWNTRKLSAADFKSRIMECGEDNRACKQKVAKDCKRWGECKHQWYHFNLVETDVGTVALWGKKVTTRSRNEGGNATSVQRGIADRVERWRREAQDETTQLKAEYRDILASLEIFVLLGALPGR